MTPCPSCGGATRAGVACVACAIDTHASTPPALLERGAVGTLDPELLADVDHAIALELLDISASTAAVYGRRFASFRAYCDEHGLCALPATVATVRAYAGRLSRIGRAASTIRVDLAAIGREHRTRGLADPTADPRLRGQVRNDAAERRRAGQRPVKRRALSVLELLAMLRELPDSLRGHRDRALLLLGFALGARRAELVALDVADVARMDGNLSVHIRAGKGARERWPGVPFSPVRELCPVRAVDAWLSRSGVTSGALLRTVPRGQVGGRLDARDVHRVIRRCADAAGLPRRAQLGAHSLRRSCVTEATLAGVPLPITARHVGHESPATTAGYVSELIALGADNPLRAVWRRLEGLELG